MGVLSPYFLVLALQAAAWLAAPTFEQFPVPEIFKGKPAAPILKTRGDRMFRTRIREGAANGPNFAGHYAIAQWGCGSACVSAELIDEKTGTVYQAPFSIVGAPFDGYMYEGKYDSRNVDSLELLSFRINSSLLIVRGCPEDKNCASYFYQWIGSQWKLIRKIPAVRLTN